MRAKTFWLLAALALALCAWMMAAPAAAQGAGDPAKGQAYARAVCAECHDIRRGGFGSKNPLATPFQSVADTKGMTATALTVFFRTPHKEMPNLIIAGDDASNAIAYILSLKQR